MRLRRPPGGSGPDGFPRSLGRSPSVSPALIDATLRAASAAPVPATPAPDGVVVGTGVRDNQLFTGLLTIFHGWAAGTGRSDTQADATDEAESGTDDVRNLSAAHVTIHDPAGLSEETTRIICTVRDRTCRAPGCDRPAEHSGNPMTTTSTVGRLARRLPRPPPPPPERDVDEFGDPLPF